MADATRLKAVVGIGKLRVDWCFLQQKLAGESAQLAGLCQSGDAEAIVGFHPAERGSPCQVQLLTSATTEGNETRRFRAACPLLRAVRLMDQLRERIRYLQYGCGTEDFFVYCCRAFIRLHGLRHPREAAA